MRGIALIGLLLHALPERPVSPPPACVPDSVSPAAAESVVVDPRDADRVFAVADRAVYRTPERSLCLIPWEERPVTEPPCLRQVEPFALSLDPQQPDTVYLGSSEGVYKSIDSGRTWEQSSNGITFSICEADVGPVAVDPLRSDVLFVGGDGIFKSLDGGGSWTLVQNGIPLGLFPPAHDFAFDPRDTDIVYLATYRLFKTRDGAQLWEPSDHGLPGPVHAVAVDLRDPDVVHAGTPEGLFVSSDSGTNWSLEALPTVGFYRLVQDPGSPAVFFAITDLGLLRSTDGGAQWNAVTAPSSGQAVSEVSIATSDPQTVYAATVAGVYRSRNLGETWERVGLTRRTPGQVFRSNGQTQ